MILTWSIVAHAGVRVMYVMATTHEYTPSLKQRIKPLITGVGPIEGGVALEENEQAPDVIVSLGSAGSRSLDHAGIYQASAASCRDMDCSALGFARGVTPFSTAPAILDLGSPILACGRRAFPAALTSSAARLTTRSMRIWWTRKATPTPAPRCISESA
jgi:adenosylhomocysteine nucleosidase